MPIRNTYGCKACGHTWMHLHMSRAEPKPPCPSCGGGAEQGLSAPAIGRNAPDTGMAVPQSQAKREQMAADLALRNTGMGDINSNMKPGDVAAKPVQADWQKTLKELPPAVQQKVREQATPRFTLPAGGDFAQATRDPYRNRNMGILGHGSNLPPVAQVSQRYRPTTKR